LVQSQFPEYHKDKEKQNERLSRRFLMTENSMQKDLDHSTSSRKDIRNLIKQYKQGIKRLKHISEKVNNHGGEERSQQEFQELHDVMSLIKEANRLNTKIQIILKFIKENKKDHPSRLGSFGLFGN
jgi:ribosomal protein S15P/S13E